MANKPFYMVFVEGQESPKYKHFSIEECEEEAKRLAKLLNRKAYVLCSIKSFEVDIFKTEDLRPDEILPF